MRERAARSQWASELLWPREREKKAGKEGRRGRGRTELGGAHLQFQHRRLRRVRSEFEA